MTELFRNTLAPWQWAVLGAVPPAIIALYFLKLRRQPLEVPSTYLWKRSIEDLHVNSLWQRLRKNLLMFLQLLLVGLAILALLRPGWEGSRLEGQRFIFLIDNSASMAATDSESGPNRLAEAKQLAEGLIDQMDSGMSAMIISFADKPQVVQEFTSNRRLLRERLASIQPTARGTSLARAPRVGQRPGESRQGPAEPAATSRHQPKPAATAYIFSDGRFEDVPGPSSKISNPYTCRSARSTLRISPSSPSRRDGTRSTRNSRQAFVQVANFTKIHASHVVVELDSITNFSTRPRSKFRQAKPRGRFSRSPPAQSADCPPG